MPAVTLIGYRGTGKSTVADALAGRLGCDRHDADEELEAAVGMPIGAYIAARGEPAFRDEETRILARLLDRGGVVATGGGVVIRPANRDLLRARGGTVVWLTAPVEVIRSRLAADPATALRRPALSGSDPLAEVEAVLRGREPLYRECADIVLDTALLSPAEVADRVAALVSSPRAGRT